MISKNLYITIGQKILILIATMQEKILVLFLIVIMQEQILILFMDIYNARKNINIVYEYLQFKNKY